MVGSPAKMADPASPVRSELKAMKKGGQSNFWSNFILLHEINLCVSQGKIVSKLLWLDQKYDKTGQ